MATFSANICLLRNAQVSFLSLIFLEKMPVHIFALLHGSILFDICLNKKYWGYCQKKQRCTDKKHWNINSPPQEEFDYIHLLDSFMLFFLSQALHIVCKLLSLSLPPCDNGTIWSHTPAFGPESSTPVIRPSLAHIWHRKRSRLNMRSLSLRQGRPPRPCP